MKDETEELLDDVNSVILLSQNFIYDEEYEKHMANVMKLQKNISKNKTSKYIKKGCCE